jgi:hypothetical protein
MKFTKMTSIWAVSALVTLILSCCLPVQIWYKNYPLISTIGSFLFMILGVLAYNQQFPLEKISTQQDDIQAIEKRNGDGRITRFIIGIFSFMIGIAFITVINNKREEYAFENEGVTTKATISDGGETITTTTRTKYLGLIKNKSQSNSYNISVDYKLESGEEMSVDKNITAEQYNEAYLAKDIEIIYYKSAPRMIKVLLGSENLRKYKGVIDRNIIGADIDKIFSTPNENIKPNILDKINIDWKVIPNGREKNFENLTTNELIIQRQNSIVYIIKGNLPDGKIQAVNGATKFLNSLIIEKEEIIIDKNDPFHGGMSLKVDPNSIKQKMIVRSLAKNIVFLTKKYKVNFEVKSIDEKIPKSEIETQNEGVSQSKLSIYTTLIFTPR